MGASITLAGESLIAQKQAANAGLNVSRFIFANVPGLNPNMPVDRKAPKPPAGQVVNVHEIPTEHAGYVNPNQVVYSAQIGSDVGDWDFNWIGLETVEGVLFAVAYVPIQQKRRNIPPLQIGNNLTRNFLVAFDGALALTGITIDAATWQHDFTVRLAGIDERERLSNRDVYGRACFFGGSLQLEKVGSAYQLKPGTAYIEGIRLVQSVALPVVPPALPAKAWLDVVLQRELNDVAASWAVVFGDEKVDYTDALGVKHSCVAIADLSVAGVIDRRPVEAIAGPLVQQFALRTGDYDQLRARATTKDDVKLGNIPNAISSDPSKNDPEVLATTKMVTAVKTKLDESLATKLSLDGGTMKGPISFESNNYSGSWARGLNFNAAAESVGGFGAFGLNNELKTLFFGLGPTPFANGNGVRVNPEKVVIEGLLKANGGEISNLNASALAQGIVPMLRLLGKDSFSANDYVRIPDVPGGLIIQFGTGTSYPNTTSPLTLPVAFPNRLLTCGAQVTEAWTSDISVRFIPIGDKKSTFYLDNSYSSSGPAYFWAIGF